MNPSFLTPCSACTATLVRLRFLLALLDNQNFLADSAKIAIWTVVELTIGIFAGSLPHLRPLLRFIPFLKHHSSHDSTAPHTGDPNARNGGTVKMSTFKSSTLVESGRRKKGSIDDGDSQEHILEDGASVYAGPGIRKNTSVTVAGYGNGPLMNAGARQFG